MCEFPPVFLDSFHAHVQLLLPRGVPWSREGSEHLEMSLERSGSIGETVLTV